MGDYLFGFKIGKIEFGMRRDFCWWFNNGYTKQFMWWYVYIDNARKEESK